MEKVIQTCIAAPLVIVLAATLRCFVQWKFSPLQELPGPPQKSAMFGYFFEILKEPFMAPMKRWLKHHRQENGNTPPFMSYSTVFGRWSVAIFDCDIIQEILTDPSAYKERQRFPKKYDFLRLSIGDGLVTLEGKSWSRHRRILQPSFQESVLQNALDQSVPALSQQLVEAWLSATGCTIDLFSHMSAVTLDILGRVSFGHDFGGIGVIQTWSKCNSKSDSVEMQRKEETDLQDIQDPMLQSIKASFKVTAYKSMIMILGLSRYMNVLSSQSGKTARLLNEAASKVIANARDKQKKSEHTPSSQESPRSLIHFLFKARDSDPNSGSSAAKYLSDLELRDETKTFIVAGHETTSSWAYWSLYALALYPKVQERLAKEVESHAAGKSPITTTTIQKMDYLQAFLTEVLRFYSPVGTIVRFTSQEEKWRGYTIPAGTRLVLPIHLIHRHPDHYNRPDEFLPDRWLDSDAVRHKFAFFPFSGGPRNCIGQKFADIEVKILVATIVRACIIHLHPDTARDGVHFTSFVSMKSRTTLKITVEERP